MTKHWRWILRALAVVSWIIAIFWEINQPGFEPLLAVLGGVSLLITSFVDEKTMTRRRTVTYSRIENGRPEFNMIGKGVLTYESSVIGIFFLIAVNAIIFVATGVVLFSSHDIINLILIVAVGLLAFWILTIVNAKLTDIKGVERYQERNHQPVKEKRRLSIADEDRLATDLELGHHFNKGLCTYCGCSSQAVLHFKWKCDSQPK